MRAPTAGQVSISHHDPNDFHIRSNEDVWAIVDDLELSSVRLGKTAFKHKQTEVGFNHVPEGLLQDKELRTIYRPVDHTIRDWQHTIAQDGVANTHIACLLHALHNLCGIDISRVSEFATMCHYPATHGKLDKKAFGSNRLHANTITSFSSPILTMVSVLHLFVEKFVADIVPEHFAAFTLLHHIVGILRMGPEDAMRHTGTLTQLISRHLESVVRLYGDHVKPKAHHLFHVVDGMLWIGKLLSCFVTERKHREIKRAALHVFRHIEHTVLTDVVNKSFEQILEGHELYKPCFLVNPRDAHVPGIALRKARSAVLRIGETWAGDVVITNDGIVGKVICMWTQAGDDTIYSEIDVYRCVPNDARFRCTDGAQRSFIDSATLSSTLIWYEESPGIICISLPPALLFDRV